MEKKKLLLKLEQLTLQFNESVENMGAVASEMEQLLDEYVKTSPKDSEIWIKLALSVYTSAVADEEKTINCLKQVLTYDPNNAIAIIILAYVQDHLLGIDEDLFQKINNCYSENPEVRSMLEYVKSFYFRWFNNLPMYEKSLVNSVNLWDKHVKNLDDLGGFYIRTDRTEPGKKLVKKALSNIVEISGDDDFYDLLNPDRFLNEYIKGTHINDSIKKGIECNLYDVGNNYLQ